MWSASARRGRTASGSAIVPLTTSYCTNEGVGMFEFAPCRLVAILACFKTSRARPADARLSPNKYTVENMKRSHFAKLSSLPPWDRHHRLAFADRPTRSSSGLASGPLRRTPAKPLEPELHLESQYDAGGRPRRSATCFLTRNRSTSSRSSSSSRTATRASSSDAATVVSEFAQVPVEGQWRFSQVTCGGPNTEVEDYEHVAAIEVLPPSGRSGAGSRGVSARSSSRRSRPSSDEDYPAEPVLRWT